MLAHISIYIYIGPFGIGKGEWMGLASKTRSRVWGADERGGGLGFGYAMSK